MLLFDVGMFVFLFFGTRFFSHSFLFWLKLRGDGKKTIREESLRTWEEWQWNWYSIIFSSTKLERTKTDLELECLWNHANCMNWCCSLFACCFVRMWVYLNVCVCASELVCLWHNVEKWESQHWIPIEYGPRCLKRLIVIFVCAQTEWKTPSWWKK